MSDTLYVRQGRAIEFPDGWWGTEYDYVPINPVVWLTERGAKMVDTWDFGEIDPGSYLVYRLPED